VDDTFLALATEEVSGSKGEILCGSQGNSCPHATSLKVFMG